MMMWIIVIIGSIFTQSDWMGGPGVQGPVMDWDKAFHQCDSVTYNIQWQVSPVAAAGAVNYTAWLKHIIDSGAGIDYHSIWPADFDNDGDIDFAGWKGAANQLVFYENDGSNVFTSVATYTGPNTSEWGFMYGADLNNDGLTDVVIPGGENGGLRWYENTGGFSFIARTISTSASYYFVYGGDIDNDNDTDLVVSRGGERPVQIWENDGAGNFSVTQSLWYESWRVKFGDLNNDGFIDLVIGDPADWYEPKYIRVLLNNGAGNFSQVTTIGDGRANDALWLRDMDNDGDLDITCGVGDGAGMFIWWVENDGTGTGWTTHTVYQGSKVYGDGGCVEDFDFDGLADVTGGWRKMSWFRQIGPDNFTEYVIDYPSSETYTHWIYPIKLSGGTCFQSQNVDLLVCWGVDGVGSFVWYENQMVSEFAHGWLTSSILELDNQERELLWFGWEACVPADSTLAFSWRADSTVGGITAKPWNGPHYSIVGESIKDSIDLPPLPCYRYFQYKAEFWPSGSDAAVVHEAWLTDTACPGTGIEDQDIVAKEPFSLKILGTEISLSMDKPVRDAGLYVYSIAGELVQVVHEGRLEAHSYRFAPELSASGVYFVVLRSSLGTKTAKLLNLR